MIPFPAAPGQQTAFPAVPLAMEGLWLVLREGEASDPDRPETMVFAGGEVTHSWFQEDDADCYSFLSDFGTYSAEGGTLTIEMDIDEDVSDRIVGAAPVSPDALQCTRFVREDGEVTESRFSLIRPRTA